MKALLFVSASCGLCFILSGLLIIAAWSYVDPASLYLSFAERWKQLFICILLNGMTWAAAWCMSPAEVPSDE